MFRKILVANRGGIAIRILWACKELGVKTVGVYSSADQNAQHVQLADKAILLGEAEPKDSYLNADKLIHAAIHSNADAIHPGYIRPADREWHIHTRIGGWSDRLGIERRHDHCEFKLR